MAFQRISKVPALPPGAVIGIVSPSGPSRKDRFELGIAELERRGFRYRCPLDPTEFYGRYEHGFASGSIQDRARSFMELVNDPEVKLLLSVRGAYGSLDILPRLEFEAIHSAKKTLAGLSDISVLLTAFASRGGLPAIHGPSLASSFADSATSPDARESVDALFRLLQDPTYRPEFPLSVLRAGTGRGQIIASNLTMLLTLLGTPWDPDYSDCILIVEEVGEAPYRIHRAFTQLKLAGKLDQLSGLVFGRFSKCTSEHGPVLDEVVSMILRDLIPNQRYPVLTGLESGHWGKNLPLPIGCEAEIRDGTLRLLESPVSAV